MASSNENEGSWMNSREKVLYKAKFGIYITKCLENEKRKEKEE